jgi:hypothetical protein
MQVVVVEVLAVLVVTQAHHQKDKVEVVALD